MAAGFFYDETNKNKLLILYIIKALNTDLTRDQIAEFCTAYDIVPYFDAMTTIGELEETGLVHSVSKAFGRAYKLTEDGSDILNMFYLRIPESRRDKLDRFADECRDHLRLQTQYSADVRELLSGGYVVTLKSMEPEQVTLGIEMFFTDLRSANKAVARWRNKSVDVYKAIHKILSGDEEQ